MSITDRKKRQVEERRQRIIDAARSIAEEEGWAAVTIRRLATEIEYSQPVLYSHFVNREAIIEAVALLGFEEITEALQRARQEASTPSLAVRNVAECYLEFARKEPALYAAMFTMSSSLVFASEQTPRTLRHAFTQLVDALTPYHHEPETAAEVFWGGLHGLAELLRTGRTPDINTGSRLNLLVSVFTSNPLKENLLPEDN